MNKWELNQILNELNKFHQMSLKKEKKKKISFKQAELIVAIYDDFESYQIYLVQLRSEFQNFAKALCEKQ